MLPSAVMLTVACVHPRDKSSTKWIRFFLFFVVHLAFCAVIAVGVPSIAAS